MSKPRSNILESLILEAMLVGAKKQSPPEIYTIDLIRDLIGVVKYSEGARDVWKHMSANPTKISNAMGKVAEFGASQGYMIIPAVRKTANKKRSVKGWVIIGSENKDILDREFAYITGRDEN